MNKEFIPYEQALALKKLVKLKPMNKEFCTYSQSIALKELGFDEPCLAVYNNPEFMWARQLKGWEDHELDNVTNSIYAEGGFVTAPTYSQAFRWLYQKLDIEKGVMPLDTESQELLLKELIDKVSSKHLLV